MTVLFLGPAETEVEDAIHYYNQQPAGLGFEFAAEVKRAVGRIIAHPEISGTGAGQRREIVDPD